ncbi:hypothetical protein Ahy_B07g088617 [Arachis hypogaea]|uniref:Uncharacterized protein n=1 Tax=Arachis hypogaea TaxID=3818 RepID=A0A444YF17_ARAHY|nr:hypothetical protein Ahy_B07g088617 [Arachis hypogaea]
MFNGLGVNIMYPDFNVQYSLIFQRLNAFCARPWNKKVATLRRDSCNTPWKTVVSIAGIFLLVLTVVQTVFSILQEPFYSVIIEDHCIRQLPSL